MVIEDPELMNYISYVEQTYFVIGMFCGLAVGALIVLIAYGFYLVKKIDEGKI